VSEPRLSLEHVSMHYGASAAVEDMSLVLKPGQITCLLGPSGCGKSTTLRIAAGVEQQSSGVVCIDGGFRVVPASFGGG